MMKSFIAVLLLLLIVVLWLITNPTGISSGSSRVAGNSDSTLEQPGKVDQTTNKTTNNPSARIDTTTGNDASRRTGKRQNSDEAQLSTMEAFQTAADLATLYQELLIPANAEDIYYRYKILTECHAVQARGLDAQLKSCENTASNIARENTEQQLGFGESFTASEIVNACFRFTERCTNVNFDLIKETRLTVLDQALEQGSVLARSANLYRLSEDDPQQAREWLADVLNQQPGPDLLRNTSNFLRSAFKLRDHPFYGVNDTHSLQLAEHALDLTACRLEQGCPPASYFMQAQCTRLPGCSPWQGYEEWLYQNYAASPEDLARVLELSQDYQQLLINQQAHLLVFPDSSNGADG